LHCGFERRYLQAKAKMGELSLACTELQKQVGKEKSALLDANLQALEAAKQQEIQAAAEQARLKALLEVHTWAAAAALRAWQQILHGLSSCEPMQEKLRELTELKCQLSSQLETIAQGNEALRAEQDAVKNVSLALVRRVPYLSWKCSRLPAQSVLSTPSASSSSFQLEGCQHCARGGAGEAASEVRSRVAAPGLRSEPIGSWSATSYAVMVDVFVREKER
jgi:hypothetical protein